MLTADSQLKNTEAFHPLRGCVDLLFGSAPAVCFFLLHLVAVPLIVDVIRHRRQLPAGQGWFPLRQDQDVYAGWPSAAGARCVRVQLFGLDTGGVGSYTDFDRLNICELVSTLPACLGI